MPQNAPIRIGWDNADVSQVSVSGVLRGVVGTVVTLLAGVAIVATFWLADHASQMGRGASIVPNVAGFDADDFMIVVPLAIWLDGQRVILTAAAIGAPAVEAAIAAARLVTWRGIARRVAAAEEEVVTSAASLGTLLGIAVGEAEAEAVAGAEAPVAAATIAASSGIWRGIAGRVAAVEAEAAFFR